jgi:hypothetical protein
VELLQHLLTYDPEERWSCRECLHHEFLSLDDSDIFVEKLKMGKIIKELSKQ